MRHPIRPVVLIRDAAKELSENFFFVKGFALGRGMDVFRINRAEAISRADFEVIRRDLPRAAREMRKSTAGAV
jgi:hypothetical protein